MSMFSKATKAKARLRLAITGPSGSGKTYTALAVGKHLGARVALVDTERGSASKYAGDVASFETLELELFTVENYLRAIKGAASEGFDVLIVDSLSHAWNGRGGILEQADKMGGKFSAWAKLTPLQQQLMDAILTYPGHVIVTMRSKMAYEVSVEEGKNGTKQTRVEKLGLAPVQRDDVSFEFDVMLDMNDRNVASVTKSRCSAIAGKYIDKPGEELAVTLKAWLSDGVEVPQTRPTESKTSAAPSETTGPSGVSSGATANGAVYTLDKHIDNLGRIGKEKLPGWVAKLSELKPTAEQIEHAWKVFSAKCMAEGVDPNAYVPQQESA